MKKVILYTVLLVTVFWSSSCEKNDPITELGTTNGEFSAQISMSFNNTRPAIGDTVAITVSTWQRDDRFDRIEFHETIFESFGIQLRLEKGTSIDTKDIASGNSTFSTLILTDTIKNMAVWNTVLAKDLDQYWVTVSNNYVIRFEYEVERLDGKYPSDISLISSLSDIDFAILKSILAYNITKEDYLLLFPEAPETHFTNGGTYALTQSGINNLKENLVKENLTPIVSNVAKKGTYNVRIDARVITPTGAVTSATPRTFENNI